MSEPRYKTLFILGRLRVFIQPGWFRTEVDVMKPTFTIGIEEEYQTVDPVTRDLRSHIHAEMIEKGKLLCRSG